MQVQLCKSTKQIAKYMYNLTKQMTLLDYFTFLMNHSININENKSGDWPLNTCTYLIANTPHFKVDR